MQWKYNRNVIEWKRNAIESNKNARIKYWKVVGMHASSAGIQYKCAQGFLCASLPRSSTVCMHSYCVQAPFWQPRILSSIYWDACKECSKVVEMHASSAGMQYKRAHRNACKNVLRQTRNVRKQCWNTPLLDCQVEYSSTQHQHPAPPSITQHHPASAISTQNQFF